MTARRLVFGDDGSAAADEAWRWIDAHRWPGWIIAAVTAIDPAVWAVMPPERVPLHAWQSPHPRSLTDDDPTIAVEHLVGEGDPRAVLDSCGQAALMVLGPRGSGFLQQLHLGSTSEWLLQAPCPPVVLVRSARPTHHVLVSTDGSVHAGRAVATLTQLPWIGGAEVTVLSVRDGRTDVERAAADAAAVLAASGVNARVVLPEADRHLMGVRPDVRAVIFRAIADSGADLVALGTAGFGTLRRAFLGSTASAVARHAPCSVLVAHELDGDVAGGSARPGR
jgi:nucleotide-binding universal stress UspA family protein